MPCGYKFVKIGSSVNFSRTLFSLSAAARAHLFYRYLIWRAVLT